jgi:large subunit ribosomal protein L17
MANRKLGRTSAHRAALFRNQLASMVQTERIITTLIKAKELRPLIEKLVTLGREDSVHNRRQAERSLPNDVLVKKLFEKIAPRFAQRPGGYTRIVKLGPRRGDGAEMAILEFVDFEGVSAQGAEKSAKKAPKKQAAPAEGGEEKEAAPKAEKPAKKPAAKKAAPKKEKAEKKPAKKASDDKPKKATKKKA